MTNHLKRLRALPIWRGPITAEKLDGGRTNLNFLVADDAGKYVVRFGDDIPAHHVMRFNELAASRAAHAAGISPAVIHADKGVSVISYIEAQTLDEPDIGAPGMLERIIPLLKTCHHEIPLHLRGPAMIFWVFHVLRNYMALLDEAQSAYAPMLPELRATAQRLENASGPYDIVFGHNDLVAANLLDDGKRLWLIDWDYAGFNTPLFDLGGLASNAGLNDAQERHMLELYFGQPADDDLFHRYFAMKTASILREAMWSMVSETISALDVDYAGYTEKNLERFRTLWNDYCNL